MINLCKCFRHWFWYKHITIGIIGPDKGIFKYIILEKSECIEKESTLNNKKSLKDKIISKTKYVGYTKRYYFKIIEIHKINKWEKYFKKCNYFVYVILNQIPNICKLSSLKENKLVSDMQNETYKTNIQDFIIKINSILDNDTNKTIYLITDTCLDAAKIIHGSKYSFNIIILDLNKKEEIQNIFQ